MYTNYTEDGDSNTAKSSIWTHSIEHKCSQVCNIILYQLHWEVFITQMNNPKLIVFCMELPQYRRKARPPWPGWQSCLCIVRTSSTKQIFDKLTPQNSKTNLFKQNGLK